MPKENIINKIEELNELPGVPVVLTEILSLFDKDDVKSKDLVALIDKDQSLTFKVLRVANSPFYGFSRKISTIELAIALIGLKTIKEIVVSLVVKEIFIDKNIKDFDIKNYWHYTLFSAVSTKYFAKKLGYKLLGEAFVTGLMHDIGIIIIAYYFNDYLKEIFNLLKTNKNLSFIDAEKLVYDVNHAEIGYLVSNKWNLPSKISKSIKNHHYHFTSASEENSLLNDPLTSALALSEYFANELGFMKWNPEQTLSELFIGPELFLESSDDILDAESVKIKIKQELMTEFEKIAFF